MTTEDLRTMLTRKLAVERPTMQRMDGLYDGTSPLAFIHPDMRDLIGDRVSPLPVNLCRLAVDVLAQRLAVSGFRSAVSDVVDNELTDLWKAVGLAESSQMAQVDALVHGRAYFVAWTDERGAPCITAESPLQMTVMRDPVTRSIWAALKRWRDVEGFTRSLVLTADTITEYASRAAAAPEPTWTFDPTVMGEDMLVVSQERNPLGIVPVTALVNRPRLSTPDGESELTDLESPVRAIAKLGSDMMIASEANAIPRRWMGTPAALTREQAVEAQELTAKAANAPASSRMLVLGGGSELHELSTADLVNFRTAIDMLIGQVAALASLPDYYVNGNTANPTSADAIRSSESRLTAKARQRQAWWSPAYSDVMRMAVLLRDGVEDARLAGLETLWVDPEPTTVAQTADAVTKTYAAGIIDRRAALVELGLSPLEIERILLTNPASSIA